MTPVVVGGGTSWLPPDLRLDLQLVSWTRRGFDTVRHDPAAMLAPAIAAARADRKVPVIVSLVGTDLDPQGLDAQRDALVAAGAEVHLSNAAATRRALDLLSRSTKGAQA